MEEIVQKECDVPPNAVRLFLSYARQEELLAEAVYLRLIEAGYVVFWDKDKDSLPPGRAFDARIAREIQLADVMVFLVSKASIRKGSYALTELEIARESRPNPSGYFLPVLVEPLQVQKLPEFFKSVTVLHPKGNVVAEIQFSVHQLVATHCGSRTISEKLSLIDQIYEDARKQKVELAIAKIDADWNREKRKYQLVVNGKRTSIVVSKKMAFATVVAGGLTSLMMLLVPWGNPDVVVILLVGAPVCIGIHGGMTLWNTVEEYESKKMVYKIRRQRAKSLQAQPQTR